jgi:hypothetical protein
MKHYTPKEVNLIKREIRTGKPLPLIADDLAKEWGRPRQGLYTKVVTLSRKTYKINKWDGPTRKVEKPAKPSIVQETINFTPMNESLLEGFDDEEKEVIVDISKGIINLPKEEPVTEPVIEQQPAEIGIEVPVNDVAFVGTPSKVVIYKDHVRYYYSNENN